MVQTIIEVEWQKLCEEHEAARDACFQALAVITQKFSAIAKGTSNTNPTDEELDKSETACKEWENVKRKMIDFVKEHV